MIGNIASEDAQVCSSRVAERGKLTADAIGTAVITGQFEHWDQENDALLPPFPCIARSADGVT